MGLFEFAKSAGAKLFGIETEETQAQKEQTITTFVNKYDFNIANFGVSFEDGVATLTGEAQTAEDHEKVILTVGNVDGIEKVNDQMTVATPQPQAQFYQVQAGDSLSKIAQTYYGDAKAYEKIFQANKPMLDDPSKIYPGQTLRIPTA